MRSLLSISAVLALSSIAAAEPEPIRADIVEIRHGREANHEVFLGWTADGHAVAQQWRCDDDGRSNRCRAVLSVAAAGRPTEETVLLEVDPYPSPISTADASHAIRAERAVLDKLGPLEPGQVTPRPAIEVSSERCWVHLVTTARDRRHTLLSLVDIKNCEPGPDDSTSYSGVQHANITGIHVSPSKLAVAVMVSVTIRMWPGHALFSADQLVVISWPGPISP